MGTHYTAPTSTDVSSLVRVFFVDGTGAPAPGLTVPYSLRDATGASILSGTLTDLVGAPGWYVTGSLVLGVIGIYTVEYFPPLTGGFRPDADSILIVTSGGGGPGGPQTNNRFIYSGKAIIGEQFVFTGLFTDQNNVPINVNNPTVETFYFDRTTNNKIPVTAAGTPLPFATPSETGRYAYCETIPSNLTPGDVFYAEMQGADPTVGGLGTIKIDQVVSLVSPLSPGDDLLNAQFVSPVHQTP